MKYDSVDDKQSVERLLSFSRGIALILISLGMLVLSGWFASFPALTHVVSGWASMKVNTALCFVLSGLLLWRVATKTRVSADAVSWLLFSCVFLLALISLLEYGLHLKFSIDELLISDPESRLTGQPPGRMSPATSVSFLCLSAALVLVDFSAISLILSLLGLLLSLVALTGFLYKTQPFNSVKPLSTIAIHTAAGLLLFALAILTMRRKNGLVPLLDSSYANVAMTRPLLGGAILLPPCLGILCLQGQRFGWYPSEFTVAVMTVLLVLAGVLLLWLTGQSGLRIEMKRQRAENDLHSRTEELKVSNKALEQYAFAAAHDLQEPLRMISLYSEKLVRLNPELIGEEEKFCLDTLRSSSDRMSALVSDLLLHARLLANREKTFADLDMNFVFTEALSQLKLQIEDTGAQITADRLPKSIGDRSQMSQLFQNLLSNSIKYRKPGTIPAIHVSSVSNGSTDVFSVADRGIGFEMKYEEQIFGVFKRLHGREIAGTGIGLAICKRIVEQHGGRIWVESEPDRGSTFFFTLRA